MKFDFLIGNPPYQEEDGGASASARPVYQIFFDGATKITSKAVCLVMPARWYSGGKGLDEFRDAMLNDHHIKTLHDFPNTNELFPNVNIRGGVCIVVWDKNFENADGHTKVIVHEGTQKHTTMRSLRYKDIDIFIRNYQAISILNKTKNDTEKDDLARHVSPRRPFGLGSEFSKSNMFYLSEDGLKKPVECVGKRKQIGFIEYNDVAAHIGWIDIWKVFVPRANNIGTELNDDNLNSFVGKAGTICTEAYIAIGMDLNLNDVSANALAKYLQTKLNIPVFVSNQSGGEETANPEVRKP